MYLAINQVRKAYQEGRPSFGIYVKTPSPMVVEMLGAAGLDFIRIDLEGGHFNTETVTAMIRSAHAVGITPFVRVDCNDPLVIQSALNMGAMGVIVPDITNARDVQAAVRAAKAPPLGERQGGAAGPLGGYGRASADQYQAWAAENIMLSVQLETTGALREIDAILQTPGLDMVHSGRGTLSADMGLPGQQYHPAVLAAEATVMEKGMAAGKMVGVQYYPLRDQNQIETIRDWVRRGVHCISLGVDTDIVPVFRQLLMRLKA